MGIFMEYLKNWPIYSVKIGKIESVNGVIVNK